MEVQLIQQLAHPQYYTTLSTLYMGETELQEHKLEVKTTGERNSRDFKLV